MFACKGRPFATLVSDNLPIPDTNLIDHHMVRDLGLKISNPQCRKSHFAGHKMRILGRVSTAIQCIKDGKTSGSYHLKGLVVTNLDQLLDTQVVAGVKMRTTLKRYYNERKCSTDESKNTDTDSDSPLETNADSDVSTWLLKRKRVEVETNTAWKDLIYFSIKWYNINMQVRLCPLSKVAM